MKHEIPVGSTFGSTDMWWRVEGYNPDGTPILYQRDTYNLAYWNNSSFHLGRIKELGYWIKFPAEKKRRGFAQFIVSVETRS